MHDYLARNGAKKPAIENRMSSVTNDDVINSVAFHIQEDLL
jgi:hypothetical protein